MLFMSIYTYAPEQRNAIVKRAVERGDSTPEGIQMIGEWIDISGGRIFSLFETNNPNAILASNYAWSDLGRIEITPVMEAEKVMKAIQGS
ncbi:MAG: DUF3303 family protein [Desulfobacterales bacterium]|nr:MAG: DUF3303 family protein [Desulfobacterales bacterium]